jgi:hypothetical protein
MTFQFNGDYNDLEQVAEFLPEFEAILAEIEAAGQYRYNDSFKGRIPGIANTEKRGPNVGTHEEAAIYLLQGLERARRQAETVELLIADDCEWLDALDREARYALVVLVPTRRMGGEWQEFEDARIVPRDGKPYGVLPKGARTRGTLIMDRKVLVKA